MPTKRIPWVKLWHEAIDHPKVASLSDADLACWVRLLARAGQQPKRGQFASVKHAAVVTGRPEKQVLRLVAVGLLDDTPDGLLMHDWEDWQRWRKEDGTTDETTPEPPTINTRSTTDPLAITTPKKREERREKEEIPPTSESMAASAAEADGVDEVWNHYRAKIQPLARVAPRKKIATRLKRFTVAELLECVDHFADDPWRMAQNAHMGGEWFFESDAQVEKWLLLRPRPEPVPLRPTGTEGAQLRRVFGAAGRELDLGSLD